MKRQNPDKPNRDKTRDKAGVKATRRGARKAKAKRRAFESQGWR